MRRIASFLTMIVAAAVGTIPAAAQPMLAEPIAAAVLTPDAALVQDATEVARVRGIDPARALADLRAQEASISLTEWIEGRYRDRIAGIAIDHDPDFRITVRLTGRAPVPDAMVRFGDILVPVRFRTGAGATRTEMLDAITAHQAAIRAMLVRPPAMGVDPRRGELVVLIGLADARGDVPALRRRIETLTGVPVRIAAADQPGIDLIQVEGGGRVVGTEPTDGRRYACTSGFVVTDGTRTGIVTAAHCPDTLAYIGADRRPTAMEYVGQWGWGFHDVQVNATAQAVRPVFFSDTARTTLRPVLGQRSRAATRAGDIVCHRGERTGYSCAEVELVDFAPSGDLCGGPCLPTWVTVAGPGCKGGDSGGPVFIGTTAIGLLKGGSYRADGSCAFYYYMSLDYLPEGWRLLRADGA